MESGQITGGVQALVALLIGDYPGHKIDIYHHSDGAACAEVSYTAKQLVGWSLNCLIRLCERKLYYRIQEITTPSLVRHSTDNSGGIPSKSIII